MDRPIRQWVGLQFIDPLNGPERVSVLAVPDRGLAGPITPELSKLTELKVLDLANNELGGRIPPELGNLRNLEVLLLEKNNLCEQVPPELRNLLEFEKFPSSQDC